MSLDQKREKLLSKTQELISLSQQRKGLVEEIHAMKKLMSLKAWDPSQEKKLFEQLDSKLSGSSLKELLWFSLTIEMQSGVSDSYPCWTQRVHLEKSDNFLSEQINPLLLKMFSPAEYAKLSITDSIKKQIEECSKHDK